MISYQLSQQLPQGFSSTGYLLHQISRPSDGNTDQSDTCDLSLPTPVTTRIASQALVSATAMSSSDLEPYTSSDPLVPTWNNLRW